jgi:hypothetical protein
MTSTLAMAGLEAIEIQPRAMAQANATTPANTREGSAIFIAGRRRALLARGRGERRLSGAAAARLRATIRSDA